MKKNWFNDGYLIAYPFEWQRPAKTEEWTWDYLSSTAHRSNFIEFISFPWATLIDLIRRQQNIRSDKLINELNNIPPKKKLFRVTVCQHVKLKEIIHLYKKLKVTDIFWPHKIRGEDVIDGIRVHPYVLYPYAYYEKNNNEYKKIQNSEYLTSFIGAYDKGRYLNNIREKIFEFEHKPKTLIIKRSSWHFEIDVYQNQVNEVSVANDKITEQKLKLNEYIYSLENTAFCLCPSGAGPNTIRYWEVIALGRIPILISDTWDRPSISEISTGLEISEAGLADFMRVFFDNDGTDDVLFRYKDLICQCEKNRYVDPIKWLDSIFDNFYSNQSLKNLVRLS